MRLDEIMTTDVVSIGPDETANAAWVLMGRKNIRHLVVTEGKSLLGVLSDRDLGGRQGAAIRKGRTVRELMTPRVAVATPGMTLRQAANVMRGRLIGSLPVVDGGRVVGIATATDVLHELGRGSSRPAVRAQRKAVRMPPSSLRAAKRAARKRAPQAAGRVKKATRTSKPGRGDSDTGPPERLPIPDSIKRAPFPAQVPRAQKRAAPEPTAADLPPANVRATGGLLAASERSYVQRRLGRKLGKFASSIERTSVRVDDVNGPKGGVDKRCRIKVVLSGLPSIVVDERHRSLRTALDGALDRVGNAVRQSLGRRSQKPLARRRDKRVSASL